MPQRTLARRCYGKVTYTRNHTVSAKELDARQLEAMEIALF
jgi:hypothetical protein